MNKFETFVKYLPHKVGTILEGVRGDIFNTLAVESCGYNYELGLGIQDALAFDTKGYNVKLLLYPISTLTIDDWKDILTVGRKAYSDRWEVKRGTGYLEIFNSDDMTSFDSVFFDPFEVNSCRANQIDIIEELYSRHIDIDNSIKKGYAKDITKITRE